MLTFKNQDMTDMEALACTEQNRVVLKGQLELTEQPENK